VGGNGVSGAAVRLVVNGSGGTVSDLTVNTDANGRVSLAAIPALTATGIYTVTATNAALSGSPITLHLAVSPASAHHLSFVQQPPSRQPAGIPFTTTVEIVDQFGNRVSTGAAATTSVTLSLGGPTGALLGPNAGAATQAAAAGLATFNVSVDKANNG